MARNQFEGGVPFDRHIAVLRGVVHQRIGQAAMLFELEIGLRHQFRDRMLSKEFGGHALASGLGGHSLNAVFAEFEGGRMLAVWPCAARAVEAVGLVLGEQRAVIAASHLFLEQVERDVLERAPACGRVSVRFDADFRFLHDLADEKRADLPMNQGYCVPKTARNTEKWKEEGYSLRDMP